MVGALIIDNFVLPTLSIRTVGAHMHWAGVDMKIEIERKNPRERAR